MFSCPDTSFLWISAKQSNKPAFIVKTWDKLSFWISWWWCGDVIFFWKTFFTSINCLSFSTYTFHNSSFYNVHTCYVHTQPFVSRVFSETTDKTWPQSTSETVLQRHETKCRKSKSWIFKAPFDNLSGDNSPNYLSLCFKFC